MACYRDRFTFYQFIFYVSNITTNILLPLQSALGAQTFYRILLNESI
jgi:hypothetical protein